MIRNIYFRTVSRSYYIYGVGERVLNGGGALCKRIIVGDRICFENIQLLLFSCPIWCQAMYIFHMYIFHISEATARRKKI